MQQEQLHHTLTERVRQRGTGALCLDDPEELRVQARVRRVRGKTARIFHGALTPRRQEDAVLVNGRRRVDSSS